MQVRVLDADTGELEFTCAGPTEAGGCEMAPDARVLPCHDRVLRTTDGPRQLDTFRFRVEGHGPGCPLRMLAPHVG